MRAIVPFDARDPKTRLSVLFDADERRAFADVMLDHVVEALHAAGFEPTVLATAPVDRSDATVRVDDRSLSAAVNSVLDDWERPCAIVMADLGILTPNALDRFRATSGDVVVAPGRGGGTNALLVREPDVRVDYHGVSCRDHRAAARAVGASTTTVDSMRLATDIDEPSDLVEVLLHGSGRVHEWLRTHGVTLRADGGRVTVERS
ncbi:2-phospho-L-lactate guanylyltransferase [Halococcoides cellulosivorans]|uniref:2-phospho-L-lactate guanylyltransferase n=1 Tax=Halococcoides cellulosivorans TaxID=1679096 RepID=A0A2R4X1F5_9EURY|nr:2-phospho-L-lactate guanylyltransferase [Halococcoides cellulosivorans]AWB27563.1 2-phospho-L-lactate guanylyltransferase [Halococcoides cellulosivorans]